MQAAFLPRPIFFALMVFALSNSIFSVKANAMTIQEVKSPGGITAWLVEEHSVPLIAMKFAFKGGSSQDPVGRAGVANFLSVMLDEGAGKYSSEKYQERLEELAMRMGFDDGLNTFYGSLQTLTKNRDASFDMLRLALTKPTFSAKAMQRMRVQLLASLAFRERDPRSVAGRNWSKMAFGKHPYARPVNGDAQSLKAITAKDLEDYRQRIFAKDTLNIVVVGDIDAKSLRALLDKTFGALPAKAKLRKIPDSTLAKGPKQQIIKMDVPQSVAHFGLPGLARADKDFIPAYVLNQIVGSGGFSSLLMEEVREKRGLAYSVYSYLQTFDHAPLYLGTVATKNESILQSLDVIKAVLRKIATEGPSAKQLRAAKDYLTGSFALRFDTSSKIAGQLLYIFNEGLGIDYVEKRNKLIEAVTLADVKRVAARLLHPDKLLVTIVGQPVMAKSKGRSAKPKG